jgi:hypothetical protein
MNPHPTLWFFESRHRVVGCCFGVAYSRIVRYISSCGSRQSFEAACCVRSGHKWKRQYGTQPHDKLRTRSECCDWYKAERCDKVIGEVMQ